MRAAPGKSVECHLCSASDEDEEALDASCTSGKSYRPSEIYLGWARGSFSFICFFFPCCVVILYFQ